MLYLVSINLFWIIKGLASQTTRHHHHHMSNDQFDQIDQNDQICQTAAFIRLAEPPAFDINRHLQNIRSQLPADQLENLEKALKQDPDLFSQVSKNDLILDCEAEESFTLESFGNLLKAARAANKDFIIARVTTLDPSGPKPQLFHSHYSAHQINKILFRTQPEEALLHRMKSRNPLNNMLIVGDVDYFVVRSKDYDVARDRFEALLAKRRFEDKPEDRELKEEDIETPNKIPSINETDDNLTDSLLFGLLQRKKLETENLQSQQATQQGSPQINVAPFENAAEFTSPNQSTLNLDDPARLSRNSSTASLNRSNSLNKLPTEGEPAILYEAHHFATDDDFLIRSDVREYFKVNSVNPDDYLLFTLYRSQEGMTEIPITGFTSIPMSSAQAAAASVAAARVKSWRNCWGLFYPPSPSLSTLRTGVISREAFKYILALYIVGCILALVFFIPLELSYFIGFGMFVFIVFVTVFLVECNPDPTANRWNIFNYRQRMQQQREMATANANITSSHTVSAESAV